MSLEWFRRGGGPAALCLAIETALLSPVVLGLAVPGPALVSQAMDR